jgi:voltage-gated potassium channel
MLFLLVLLPFTFIEFFYEPWMNAQAAARAPRQLPATLRGHVLLTQHDPVTAALIRRLDQQRIPYAVLVPVVDDALRLHDEGVRVMVGDVDDPEAWKRARVDRAALVATTASDFTNTNVAFTVREISEDVKILATASDEASVDVLTLAGCSQVFRLEQMIGQAFARRTIGGDALAHLVGRFDQLLIAEANAHRTPLVGKTLRDAALRQKFGVSVVGVWERGSFHPPRPDTAIRDGTVMVLAGTADALNEYNEAFAIYNVSDAPVVILGGGRVGRATARHLKARDIDYRIVELLKERVRDEERTIVGSAADLDVLKRAGIETTPAVVITPHDDDLNVYLTIYCRRLRPDIQIIARANQERNVATLHRAGADIVMSYAGTGASTIVNWLKRSKVLTLAEGLDMFRVPVPAALAGKTIAASQIRELTGCTVVAISKGKEMDTALTPATVLTAGSEILLIGTMESEEAFLERFGARERG